MRTGSARPWVGIAVLVAVSGCASLRPQLAEPCADADAALAGPLARLQDLRSTPGACAVDRLGAECDRLWRDIEQRAVLCPAHVPTLAAIAVLSYEDGDRPRARSALDAIEQRRGVAPDAMVLRIRLALDDGNMAGALRMAADGVRLSPAHAGLREVRAAALFAARRFEDAGEELTIAATLGAPGWRIAYARGLIAELSGHAADARREYAAAVQARPGWALPADRLRALEAATAR